MPPWHRAVPHPGNLTTPYRAVPCPGDSVSPCLELCHALVTLCNPTWSCAMPWGLCATSPWAVAGSPNAFPKELSFACQPQPHFHPPSPLLLPSCILNIHPRPQPCSSGLSQNEIRFLRGLRALIPSLLRPPPPPLPGSISLGNEVGMAPSSRSVRSPFPVRAEQTLGPSPAAASSRGPSMHLIIPFAARTRGRRRWQAGRKDGQTAVGQPGSIQGWTQLQAGIGMSWSCVGGMCHCSRQG